MPRPHRLAEALRTHGLTYPSTREDHPWGETVLKVKDKVFVFLGREDEDALRFSVKLPTSGSRWLDQPCAEPTGYGLGKSGWVTFTFGTHDAPTQAELCALLDESYRAVAPKKLIAELDGQAPAPAKAVASKTRARPKA
ncbi:MAG TPA: MmcQ/YjbR family DNA-binding protein [Planctomycetota bacterium]